MSQSAAPSQNDVHVFFLLTSTCCSQLLHFSHSKLWCLGLYSFMIIVCHSHASFCPCFPVSVSIERFSNLCTSVSPLLATCICCYSFAALYPLPIKCTELSAVVYLLLRSCYVKWICSYLEAVTLNIKQKVCIFYILGAMYCKFTYGLLLTTVCFGVPALGSSPPQGSSVLGYFSLHSAQLIKTQSLV